MNHQDQRHLEHILGRRKFLGGCAALSSTSLLSTILQLKMTNSAVAAVGNPDDYRAMVCIFLYGGNDSYNMLVPHTRPEYNRYASVRGDLALPRQDLLRISGPGGRSFGIHPGMPEVRDLYNSGSLSFLANVGTLIQPTSINQYRNRIAVPRGLFSHNDQQEAWQSSIPQSQSAVGWAGRMADIVNDQVNENSSISMNISLNAVNIFQTGRTTVPYVVSPQGAAILAGYRGGSLLNRMTTQATDGALSAAYANVLKNQFRDSRANAIDSSVQFQQATAGSNVNTAFPNTSLGSQLSMVARTIKARDTLGVKRQTFFVFMGGYDHHDEVLNSQAELLPQVSQAMKAFYDSTVEMGVANNVVAFTASDFGRTLTSNGRGSDHAWGGNQMVMGGPVRGGRIFGDYPTNLDGGSQDIGRGRLLPTTSVDEVHAELARWFGVSNNRDLVDILPNIRNFYSRSATSAPIGFIRPGQIA